MHALEGLKILYSPEAIAGRVRELAGEINTLYAGKPLVMVCVLKGAFMFFSDLLKLITVQPEIDFVRVASYRGGMSSTRNISFTKDVEISLEGKHVILVEDVVDTGHTVEFLVRQMAARGTASLRLAALVDKRDRREVPVQVDFPGFCLGEGFIVGYGLDYAEHHRELPAVYVVEPEKHSS